ncbi:hypothetical protein BCR43DRAFT_27697 [Syncephalastrum racemosum]|uniref:Uncharacterized protein n=1 Tax=Syncephalastrum racemosum TaxID=13706 RepID=A0A1X2HTK8_SYNRA|nr:hypothetical protein BCR43DRAFT_27697 [Syncephalastrum racemosum]
MAFAQQRRRPNTQQRRLNYETSTEDLRQVTNADANTDTNIVLSPTARLSSDSDTDWHVISASSQHRRPVHIRTSSSPTFDPSEPESLVSFRASDTESFSDLDIHHSDQSSPQFSTLPAHDGTGTFTDALSDEDSSSPSGFAQVVKKSMLRSDKGKQHDSTWRAQIADFEPDSARRTLRQTQYQPLLLPSTTFLSRIKTIQMLPPIPYTPSQLLLRLIQIVLSGWLTVADTTLTVFPAITHPFRAP